MGLKSRVVTLCTTPSQLRHSKDQAPYLENQGRIKTICQTFVSAHFMNHLLKFCLQIAISHCHSKTEETANLA